MRVEYLRMPTAPIQPSCVSGWTGGPTFTRSTILNCIFCAKEDPCQTFSLYPDLLFVPIALRAFAALLDPITGEAAESGYMQVQDL